jgi:hypothetical protein
MLSYQVVDDPRMRKHIDALCRHASSTRTVQARTQEDWQCFDAPDGSLIGTRIVKGSETNHEELYIWTFERTPVPDRITRCRQRFAANGVFRSTPDLVGSTQWFGLVARKRMRPAEVERLEEVGGIENGLMRLWKCVEESKAPARKTGE